MARNVALRRDEAPPTSAYEYFFTAAFTGSVTSVERDSAVFIVDLSPNSSVLNLNSHLERMAFYVG